jgi:hypothetical protein
MKNNDQEPGLARAISGPSHQKSTGAIVNNNKVQSRGVFLWTKTPKAMTQPQKIS